LGGKHGLAVEIIHGRPTDFNITSESFSSQLEFGKRLWVWLKAHESGFGKQLSESDRRGTRIGTNVYDKRLCREYERFEHSIFVPLFSFTIALNEV